MSDNTTDCNYTGNVYMSQKMPVRWKLRQLMSDRKMTNRELSDLIGKHENTISALKQYDEMPRVDGQLLSKLCKSLKCELWDLIEWIPDKNDAA